MVTVNEFAYVVGFALVEMVVAAYCLCQISLTPVGNKSAAAVAA